MPFEQQLRTVALLFQFGGWFALALCCVARRQRASLTGAVLLVGAVCGLGVVTLVASACHVSCALTSGLTMGLLGALAMARLHDERPMPASTIE